MHVPNSLSIITNIQTIGHLFTFYSTSSVQPTFSPSPLSEESSHDFTFINKRHTLNKIFQEINCFFRPVTSLAINRINTYTLEYFFLNRILICQKNIRFWPFFPLYCSPKADLVYKASTLH